LQESLLGADIQHPGSQWWSLETSSDSGVGGKGSESTPKVLICQKSFDLSKIWAKSLKIRAKSHKIWAWVFRHLCSHCVMNEPDCRSTSEFDFFFSKKHMNIFFLCVVSKSLNHCWDTNFSGKNPWYPQKFACPFT